MANFKSLTHRFGCVGWHEGPGAGAPHLKVAVHARLKDPLVLGLVAEQAVVPAAGSLTAATTALVLRATSHAHQQGSRY